MATISPKIAAQLALLTYDTEMPAANGRYRFVASQDITRYFDLENDPLIGTSGFALLRKQLGFGLVGAGKSSGPHRGEHIVALRGTNPGNGVDILTDGNFGLSTSENGSAAHDGFNRAFRSIRPGIQRYLDNSQGSGPVHCVGHSLGGALATLTADWVHKTYGRPVYLYTFGCPRVGLTGFAQKATAHINKIYRCTHGADVVPKVPLWPFQHIPYVGTEYRLDGGTGFSGKAHKMGEDGQPGYINSANSNSWETLGRNSERFLNTPVRLNFEDRFQASFTSYWADKISAALITLLKDAGYLTAVAGQMALGSAFTFYDMLAKALEEITRASAKLAEQAKGLLGHMLVFAGHVVNTTIDLNVRFIRWVFNITLGALARMVRRSLD